MNRQDAKYAKFICYRNALLLGVLGVLAVNFFLSSGEALKFLGGLSELRLPLPETTTLAADDDYNVQLRVHLDIEALPAPLRPVAYTTLSWHLNSGWTSWNVAR